MFGVIWRTRRLIERRQSNMGRGRLERRKVAERELFQLKPLLRISRVQTLATTRDQADLNRLLSIPKMLIFESRVCRGIPSFAAAPDGPAIRPPASAKAASIIRFS